MSPSLVLTSKGVRSATCFVQPFVTSLGATPLHHNIRQRKLSSTVRMEEKFKPARRVAGQRQDVWSIINEAAAASPKQPIGKSLGHEITISLTLGSKYGPRLFVSIIYCYSSPISNIHKWL